MKDIIKKIVESAYQSKEGHIASSLSVLDILYVFYKNLPNDKLILSKGHASLGLYDILNHFNLLEYDLDEFCKFDGHLGGRPSDKAGHEREKKDHTYYERAKKLIDIINEN